MRDRSALSFMSSSSRRVKPGVSWAVSSVDVEPINVTRVDYCRSRPHQRSATRRRLLGSKCRRGWSPRSDRLESRPSRRAAGVCASWKPLNRPRWRLRRHRLKSMKMMENSRVLRAGVAQGAASTKSGNARLLSPAAASSPVPEGTVTSASPRRLRELFEGSQEVLVSCISSTASSTPAAEAFASRRSSSSTCCSYLRVLIWW